jgi:hypothetical protein
MLKGKRGSRAVVELIILYTTSGINNKKRREEKNIAPLLYSRQHHRLSLYAKLMSRSKKSMMEFFFTF